MSDIFVQYDAGGFLACGYFPPPGLVGLKPGQFGTVFTAIILDAPPAFDPRRAAYLFFQTRIDPPCFWLPFSALGPGREVTGQPIPLAEAAKQAGMAREGLKKAVARGDLPGFKDPATRPGKGQRGYMVNSLDLERFLAIPRRPPGRPPYPKQPSALPKKRGRPPKKRDNNS